MPVSCKCLPGSHKHVWLVFFSILSLLPKTKLYNMKATAKILVPLVIIFCFAAKLQAQQSDKEKIKAELSRNTAFIFIENKGQYIDENRKPLNNLLFIGQSKGINVLVTDKGLSYVFLKGLNPRGNDLINKETENIKYQWHRIDMELDNAKILPENITTSEQTDTRYDFYFAHCPQGITNVHAYKKITVKSIYPGIDWTITCNGSMGIKYDFIVHPHADISAIKMRYKGVDLLKYNEDENKISIKCSLGELTEGGILTYEKETGKQINSKYHLNRNEVEFNISKYDDNEDLEIDPPLVWGTYFNEGTNTACNQGLTDLARDNSDNIYACGYTTGTLSGIVNLGGYYDGVFNGTTDALILGFNNFGTQKWATYYGGSYDEIGRGIACDGTNIWVTGNTRLSAGTNDFPLLNATQTTYGGGAGNSGSETGGDAFVLRFSVSNLSRQFATYLGGSSDDEGEGITIDPNGNGIATGYTQSNNFPTAGTIPQSTNAGTVDAFITCYSTSNAYQFSTYHGGSTTDRGRDIYAETGTGNNYFYVVGSTKGGTFPTSGGFQNTFGGGTYDAFVTKYNISTITAPTITWCSYYGGSGDDSANAVVHYYDPNSSNHNVFATGGSTSNNLPGLGICNSAHGGLDIFFTEILAPNTSPSVQKTYYFGSTSSDDDTGSDLYLARPNGAENGDCWLVGESSGANFAPIQSLGPACYYNQTSSGGSKDGIIMRIPYTPVGSCTINWSTYYGGTASDWLWGVCADNHDCVFVCGEMISTETQLGTPSELFDYGAGAYYNGTHRNNHDIALGKFCECPAAYAGPNKNNDVCCPGAQIGPNAQSCFTYSWSPCQGLTPNCTTANPTANPSATTTYTLTITNSNTGCTATATVKVTNVAICCSPPSGVNPATETTKYYKVFPNPTSGEFTIEFVENFSEIISLSISDVLGRTIYDKKNFIPERRMILNFSDKGKGIYFIKMLKSNGETFVKEIIIQ